MNYVVSMEIIMLLTLSALKEEFRLFLIITRNVSCRF